MNKPSTPDWLDAALNMAGISLLTLLALFLATTCGGGR